MGFLPQVRIGALQHSGNGMGWAQLGIHLLLEYSGIPIATIETGEAVTHTKLKCTAQPAIRWKRKEAGVSPASLLHLMELAIELRRRFLQSGDQLVGGRRNGAHLPIDD